MSALAVPGDRWLEHRVPVDALPARALPPVQVFAAPPRRVSAARPDAPPDEEPRPRFKWPWQK